MSAHFVAPVLSQYWLLPTCGVRMRVSGVVVHLLETVAQSTVEMPTVVPATYELSATRVKRHTLVLSAVSAGTVHVVSLLDSVPVAYVALVVPPVVTAVAFSMAYQAVLGGEWVVAMLCSHVTVSPVCTVMSVVPYDVLLVLLFILTEGVRVHGLETVAQALLELVAAVLELLVGETPAVRQY